MRRRQNRKGGKGTENEILNKIDEDTFREYHSKILKSIRGDLLAGMTAEQIFKKYEAHAAAALVSSLVSPKDSVQAAEKILDRTQGKATQKIDSTHRLEKLKDSELDSFLTSRLNELQDDDTPDEPVQ